MFKKHNLLFILLLAACSCGGGKSNPATCSSSDDCTNNPKCQCWCSVKCGFRDKKPADHPTWVDNDPNGKFCYCKQWDMDNYQDNCVMKKNIPEPADAQ